MPKPANKLLLSSPAPVSDSVSEDLQELLEALAKEDPLLGLAVDHQSLERVGQQPIAEAMLELMRKRLAG